VALYVLVLVGGGLLVGLAFRWWGLIAPVGFACFLAYAWEFYSPAVAYAVIAALISSGGVVAGSLVRRHALTRGTLWLHARLRVLRAPVRRLAEGAERGQPVRFEKVEPGRADPSVSGAARP
jgi:hypothetical protein